jgi:hypothetical protein
LAASNRAGLPRRWWPLLVSLAVHSLLIVLWVRHADRRPLAVDTPEPVTMFLVPLRPTPAPKPPDTAAAKRKDAKPAATSAPPPAAPARNESVAPTQQPPAPTAVQPETPPAASTGQILEDSRHDMAAIGRELRAQDGVSPLRARPAPQQLKPTGKWARFAQQIEDAHREPSSAVVTEEYTSPDGRTLYRVRHGNKAVCRQSGSPGPAADWRSAGAIAAGAGSKSTLGVQNSAGEVLCPESERDWKKL